MVRGPLKSGLVKFSGVSKGDAKMKALRSVLEMLVLSAVAASAQETT